MGDPLQDALRRTARSAKAASAHLAACATLAQELLVEAQCYTARRRMLDAGVDPPARSWEVEREAFLRRLNQEP